MELSTSERQYFGKHPSLESNIVGFFCVNSEGQQYVSTEHLGYLRWSKYSKKNIRMDLAVGQNEAVRRSNENEYTYYRYLSEHPELVHKFSSESFKDVGFISNRQVLRKIANLPYQDRDPERYSACLFQGNIYLCFNKGEEVSNERMDHCSRWGYKFEQYMLAKTPDSAPVTNVPINEGEEFGCIFKSKFGNHRLLYAAEMDGILVDPGDESAAVPDVKEVPEQEIIKKLNTKKFVELKTAGFDSNHRNFRRFKSREIWTQSYFSRVNSVVIGIRNYDGIVNELCRHNIDDMIEIGTNFWKPNVCLNFVDHFLTFVKKSFIRELSKIPDCNPNAVNIKDVPMIELHFERKLRSPIVLTKKGSDSVKPYQFEWFVKGVSVSKEK